MMQPVNGYGSLQFLTDPTKIEKKDVLTFEARNARFIPSGNGLLHYHTFTIDQTAHRLAGLVFTARGGEIIHLEGFTHHPKVEYKNEEVKPYGTMLIRGEHRFLRQVTRCVASIELLGENNTALKIDELILQNGLRKSACDCSYHPDAPRERFNPENHGFPENSEWPQKYRLQQVDVFVATHTATNKTHLLVMQPKEDLLRGDMTTYTITSYSEK